ncbi:jg17327 [Pararge aegeria aegeria]|uniref:Jg17327 protein n=1 Tax=Pararge aegeria aegeria TaxID=348720 RepID=A0A8S4SP78_9NEOP|nr:jg17327 [Pararge aegeria aegeria]
MFSKACEVDQSALAQRGRLRPKPFALWDETSALCETGNLQCSKLQRNAYHVKSMVKLLPIDKWNEATSLLFEKYY